MSIEKGLYEAPLGQQQVEVIPEVVEVELIGEEPEIEVFEDGSIEITVGDEPDEEDDFYANLVDKLDEGVLTELADELITSYENDLSSRKDWEETYTEGIKLLGLKYEERSEPWEGACGVHHPMIAEAAVRFQAEAIMETFPASGPVKTTIVGETTTEKRQAADRLKADLNYQLTEIMTEFRAEHEKMLWSLPIAGSAFKKVYYDVTLGRQISLFVPAEDVVLPYGVSDITLSERVTHRMRKTPTELKILQDAGFYADIDVEDAPSMISDPIQKAKDEETGFSATYDERHVLLEIMVKRDLPGFEDKDEDGNPTGIPLPYVVTILYNTGDVLSVRRNYNEYPEPTEGNPVPQSRYKQANQHFVHYQYVPGFGSYGFGLVHLVGNSAKSATSITRQLVDAGTLSNLPGGMKTKGLRIKGDDTPISPGEFRDVDVLSGALRDNIMPLPYKEPSQTLLTLLGIISEDARRFAASPDMKVSDMSAQAPVGTTLALIERNLKVMSAVQARLHNSMKQELKLLVQIIRDDTSDSYDYRPEHAPPRARKEDYSYVSISPVSDPNASTLAQRVVQYQAVIQLAQMAPDIYNLPKLHRQMLDILNIQDADELVPLDEDQKPRDPVSENVDIITGTPVKAFEFQDHAAHIQVHTSAMQDPELMKLLGQNPRAQEMMGALQAHIAEHAAFQYRQQIERQMGMPLPPLNQELPVELEREIAMRSAQASQPVLQANQAKAQQEKNQQMQQDPLIQMQQQELQIKVRDMELKEKKLVADTAEAADKMALERQKLEAELEKAGMEYGVKSANDRAKLELQKQLEMLKLGLKAEEQSEKMQAEGMRIGAEIGRTREQEIANGRSGNNPIQNPAKDE